LKPVKVLLRINDVSSVVDDASSVAVIASTEDVEFYVVDHREKASRKIKLGECHRTATRKDFGEAVMDESAPYLNSDAVIVSLMEKLSDKTK